MWECKTEIIRSGKIVKYFLAEGEKKISCQQFLNLLSTSVNFRIFFNSILSGSNFDGYFFECIPFNEKWNDAHFEFVLIKGDCFNSIKPDPSAFAGHFSGNNNTAVFPNLGKNALMIAPVPIAENNAYAHLANFTRHAPADQLDDFWKTVGRECLKYISEKSIWLSTHGLGIYWLHARVDTYPKYYHFTPYREYGAE